MTEHLIRERAYLIWQKTGSKDTLLNWLEAERQIIAELAHKKKTAVAEVPKATPSHHHEAKISSVSQKAPEVAKEAPKKAEIPVETKKTPEKKRVSALKKVLGVASKEKKK